MPNRISGGKAVVSTLQLCKTGAENEGDGKKKQLYVHANNHERRDETIRHTHNARMKSSKRERKNRELSTYTKIL